MAILWCLWSEKREGGGDDLTSKGGRASEREREEGIRVLRVRLPLLLYLYLEYVFAELTEFSRWFSRTRSIAVANFRD